MCDLCEFFNPLLGRSRSIPGKKTSSASAVEFSRQGTVRQRGDAFYSERAPHSLSAVSYGRFGQCAAQPYSSSTKRISSLRLEIFAQSAASENTWLGGTGGGSVRPTPLISLYDSRSDAPDQRSSQRLGRRTVTHEGGQTK
jgi:hypothetical protein